MRKLALLLMLWASAAFGQQQIPGVGSAPNDGTGAPLRTGAQAWNSNFTQLYGAWGPTSHLFSTGTMAWTDLMGISPSSIVWSNNTGTTAAQALYFNQLTLSGTANADSSFRGRIAFSLVQVTDTAQSTCTICTGSGAPSASVIYDWHDYTMGANWLGYRIAKLDFVTLNNPPAVCTTTGGCPNYTSPNIVISQQEVNMASHMGGLPYSVAGANGAIFGGNTNNFANAGSTFDNVTGVWDWEFDIGFNGSGSAWKKIGILVRDAGHRAYTQDNAFTVALNTPQVGDQGTFRLVNNAGGTYAASAATSGDSTGFGFGRRESGTTIHDGPLLNAFSSWNTNVTTSGCEYLGFNSCLVNGALYAGSVNVSQGITQQSATIAAINVISNSVPITASVTGTTLTLVTMPYGALARGQMINCAACTPSTFFIEGPPLTGTGVAGSTYTVSATCTAGCGTNQSMTTGETGLGSFGSVGGQQVMVDNTNITSVALPTLAVQPPPSGATATATTTGLYLEFLAVPQGFIPANGCVNGDQIQVNWPTNTGSSGTIQLTVSGANITAGTVTLQGSYTFSGSAAGQTFTFGGTNSCGAGAVAAIMPFVQFGIQGTTMGNAGSGYPCGAPPRVTAGGGHATNNETVPTFEAVLGTCTTTALALTSGLTVTGGATSISGGTIQLNNNAGTAPQTNIMSSASSTGTINLGNDTNPTTTTTNINGIVTIGSAGTQNVTVLGGSSTGNFSAISNAGTGTITLGNANSTTQIKGTINIAPAQGTQPVSILNGASSATLNVAAGTTATSILNIGNDTNPTTTTMNLAGVINIGSGGTQNVGILAGASTGVLNIMNGASSGNLNIDAGTGTGNISIGNTATPKIVLTAVKVQIAGELMSTGTIYSVAGTGACGTITTQVGGAQAGSFLCTGTTGASTFTVTFANASPNGWACWASDATAGTVFAQVLTVTTTTCKMSIATVTANDKIVFGALGF